jgi:hypothetical protein
MTQPTQSLESSPSSLSPPTGTNIKKSVDENIIEKSVDAIATRIRLLIKIPIYSIAALGMGLKTTLTFAVATVTFNSLNAKEWTFQAAGIEGIGTVKILDQIGACGICIFAKTPKHRQRSIPEAFKILKGVFNSTKILKKTGKKWDHFKLSRAQYLLLLTGSDLVTQLQINGLTNKIGAASINPNFKPDSIQLRFKIL